MARWFLPQFEQLTRRAYRACICVYVCASWPQAWFSESMCVFFFILTQFNSLHLRAIFVACMQYVRPGRVAWNDATGKAAIRMHMPMCVQQSSFLWLNLSSLNRVSQWSDACYLAIHGWSFCAVVGNSKCYISMEFHLCGAQILAAAVAGSLLVMSLRYFWYDSLELIGKYQLEVSISVTAHACSR